MKNIYTLSNHIFLKMFKTYFLPIAAITAGLEVVLLWIHSGVFRGFWDTPDAFMPYELLLANSGAIYVPALGLVAILLAILTYGYSLRQKYKAIYTIYTLPMPRYQTYLAFLLAGVTLLITFYAFQLIMLFLYYYPATQLANNHSVNMQLMTDAGEKIKGMDSFVNNGLFLAFIRNDILRLLFPTSALGVLTVVSLLLVVLGICFMSAFSQEKIFGTYGIVIIFCLLMIQSLYKLYQKPHSENIYSIIYYCVLALIVIVFGIIRLYAGEGGSK